MVKTLWSTMVNHGFTMVNQPGLNHIQKPWFNHGTFW